MTQLKLEKYMISKEPTRYIQLLGHYRAVADEFTTHIQNRYFCMQRNDNYSMTPGKDDNLFDEIKRAQWQIYDIHVHRPDYTKHKHSSSSSDTLAKELITFFFQLDSVRKEVNQRFNNTHPSHSDPDWIGILVADAVSIVKACLLFIFPHNDFSSMKRETGGKKHRGLEKNDGLYQKNLTTLTTSDADKFLPLQWLYKIAIMNVKHFLVDLQILSYY